MKRPIDLCAPLPVGMTNPPRPCADPEGDDSDVLLATLTVGGVDVHLWFYALEEGADDEPQVAAAGVGDDFEKASDWNQPDGPYQTIELGGRHYVMFAAAYCE